MDVRLASIQDILDPMDFIRKLTAKLKALYNVDRTRIFTTGHSRGAGLRSCGA